MTTANGVTREQWLESAINFMRPWFKDAKAELPEAIHVSVGFAYGARKENGKIMGQTWSRVASDDNVNHVFISPELGDTFDVVETLIHELIHVADDNQSGHRGRFGEIAVALGLTAPFTFTPSGPALQAELLTLAAALGTYPHAALNASITAKAPTKVTVGSVAESGAIVEVVKVHSGPAKQGSRMLKASCPECGYTVRVTRKWLEMGAPICPVNMIPMMF